MCTSFFRRIPCVNGTAFLQNCPECFPYIIGHIQQGGEPTVADRLLATRMVSHALHQLAEAIGRRRGDGWYVGLQDSRIVTSPLARMLDSVDTTHRRPSDQWWLRLHPVFDAVSGQAE